MRRMSAWWSFSTCDQRSTPMISRLGGWPVGEEQKEQKRKNTESKESKKNAVRVSVWWVWAFCSEEKQKEEQIKKKRERKKSREERKKKKKERKKEKRVNGGMWQCTGFWGPQSSLIYGHATEWWFLSFENRFQLFSFSMTVIHFLNHRLTKTMIQNLSKQTIIRGIHMIWMMEIENWVISLKAHLI